MVQDICKFLIQKRRKSLENDVFRRFLCAFTIYPNFNYEKNQKGIQGKTHIANLPPVISDKKIKKDKNLRIELPDRSGINNLINRWTRKI